MILRKPYAFLIKHFRLIHLILAIPIIYMIVKTGNISAFFQEYVSNGYTTNITNIAGNYVNYFMYFAILCILFVGIFIYFLMRQKEKSTIYYLLLIINYTILFIMLGVTHSILSGMETTMLDATSARAYRDISYIFYLPQFLFAAFTLFRGVGFDIKKFNFDTDIKELEITDIDSEEFELNIGIEDYKIKRNIRRFFREFRYYVLENKFIFMILCSIVVIIIGNLIYLNRDVYNKRYQEKQIISHDTLNVRVVGSMLTNIDFGGKSLPQNKYYLVIQYNIENRGTTNAKFDYNNFFIELKNRRVYATLDRGGYFIDVGLALKQDTILTPKSQNTYAVAYELDPSEIQDNYTLKILEQTVINVGQITPKYKTVNLKPDHAFGMENVKFIELGKIATFEESNIGYSHFQIKGYQIADSLTYQYQQCDSETSCRTLSNRITTNTSTKTLLILDSNYDVDQSVIYYRSAKTNRLMPEHFMTIQYTTAITTDTISVENVTPSTYQDGLIFQVPSTIKNASEIRIFVTIRNKRYVMNIL